MHRKIINYFFQTDLKEYKLGKFFTAMLFQDYLIDHQYRYYLCCHFKDKKGVQMNFSKS
jgi:hypothetical protein